MSKRAGVSLTGLVAKKQATDKKTAANNPSRGGSGSMARRNPFLSVPVQPEKSLTSFLMQCRQTARNYVPKETKFPITKPFCEIEARVGILKVNDRRVAASGPKRIQNTIVQAFDCSSLQQQPSMASGVSRSHYVHWTQGGLSEAGPLTSALGVVPTGKSKEELSRAIKNDLVETELIETVFAGYPGERRITVPGLAPMPPQPNMEVPLPSAGSFEYKEKLRTLDWTLPAAKYDLRVSLASEKIVDHNVRTLPKGWSLHRVKRRHSYSRRDKNMAWQIDVTEVATTPAANATTASSKKSVSYEIEMEIMPQAMLTLINKPDDQALSYAKSLAQQLWWILGQINPLSDVVDVEEYLQDHPSRKDVQLALATCGALKKFMDSTGKRGGTEPVQFSSPLANPEEAPPASLSNIKFCGCMPVNFSRHNMEDIQQDSNGYFVSEKTDGVRHFMIFTGSSVVLVDRAMRGKRAIPLNGDEKSEPMAHVLSLIKPGTVLDGEVVLHRGSSKHKARPVFIVFDVMAISGNTAVLHLPFEKRLQHLKKATFRTNTANRDMFDEKYVADMNLPLPLVRKNFARRTDLVDLLSHVVEEKGLRSYRNGVAHNHLTDGIIFQPNLPYVCGTDVNLLKWKYLDTVTIDVEILPPRANYRGEVNEDELRVGVLGDDQSKVDMTRYVLLPASERLRLEADRANEPEAKIAEVGFDPETGEWYYLTMRPDKVAPNHISTVLGTLLELSESLTTAELQYRLSLPAGARDTYRKDVRGMMSQLLQHQQKKQKSQHPRK